MTWESKRATIQLISLLPLLGKRRLVVIASFRWVELIFNPFRLIFGSFQPQHLNHSWHKKLHEEDKVLYFPNELSMVYRTSLLLRGLAMSLQLNVSVGEQWRHHAQVALETSSNIEGMSTIQ